MFQTFTFFKDRLFFIWEEMRKMLLNDISYERSSGLCNVTAIWCWLQTLQNLAMSFPSRKLSKRLWVHGNSGVDAKFRQHKSMSSGREEEGEQLKIIHQCRRLRTWTRILWNCEDWILCRLYSVHFLHSKLTFNPTLPQPVSQNQLADSLDAPKKEHCTCWTGRVEKHAWLEGERLTSSPPSELLVVKNRHQSWICWCIWWKRSTTDCLTSHFPCCKLWWVSYSSRRCQTNWSAHFLVYLY